MAEIYVNTISKVGMKTFYAGNIIDALIPITASIYDITEDQTISPAISPTTPLYAGIIAEKTETDPGSYEIIIPYAITDRPRKLKVTWQYLYGSQAITQYTFVDVVVPYASIEEAITDLGISTDPSDPNYKSYHELSMAEKYARKVVEDFTGQDFYTYFDVDVVYGSGSDILPTSTRVEKIYKLYADDILLIDTLANPPVNNWGYTPIVSETGFGIRLDRTTLLDNTVYVANGMVPPSISDEYAGQAFRKGVRYKIVGEFGWSRVPDEVEQATIQLMGHYFAKDRAWADRYLKNVSTFDWDFEYSDEVYKGTGCAYADKLLSEYVITSIILV
jgi:hypothetical protein